MRLEDIMDSSTTEGKDASLMIRPDDMTTVAYEEEEEPLLEHGQGDPRARAIILGFECLDSTANSGVSNNLVVYLQTVLHDSNASSAAAVTAWYGASFFVPIVAAVVADSYLGRYKTIFLSLILYLIFDDAKEREKKQQFFSWFYICLNCGGISAGIFIIWIQDNISWSLGFSISMFCIAIAFCGFMLGTPIYQQKVPSGSPLKSLFQVLVCLFKNIKLELPVDSSLLYEDDGKGPKLQHTDEYRLLDKAAILLDYDAEESKKPVEVCTVTQVEEFKIFLRLLPIWASGIVYSAVYYQMWTTFIQQGTAMNTEFMSISVPSASLPSFEVLCVMIWVLVYNKFIVPKMATEPTKLQRMGIGYFLVIISMAIAAFVEMKRLQSVQNGEIISIAWQLPQYFVIAGSEVFAYIAQLEFFYDEAPDSMKSMCTAFSMVAVSLGNYLSSLIVTLVTVLTTMGGNPGWIPDDLNYGHLDYFFWSLSCLSVVNLVVYIVIAKRYKLKRIIIGL